MKAKTVNEIAKGGSGWGAIGVGHSAMNDGYKNLVITSPHCANAKPISDEDYTWASLLPLKDLIPTLLDTSPDNIISAGGRSITDDTEKYLNTQVFNDGNNLEKKTISLNWKDTDRIVIATIYTNYIKGVTIAEYTTPENRDVAYYFFRKK